jgi:hypothetical protein
LPFLPSLTILLSSHERVEIINRRRAVSVPAKLWREVQEDVPGNLTNRPGPGGSFPGQAVYAHSVNTKRNVVGPSIRTPNAQGTVAGIVIHALENGRLELLAEQACEN